MENKQLITYEQSTQKKLSKITKENKLGKSTSLAQILSPDSQEPSLAMIRKIVKPGNAKIILHEALNKMIIISGIKLIDAQVDYLVEFIFRNYYWYTISDFNIITELLLTVTNYQPNLQDVIRTINDYDSKVRTLGCEEMQIKKATELRQEQIDSAKIIQGYQKLKAEAKNNPKKTIRKKRYDDYRVNQEKMQVMMKEFPDAFKGKSTVVMDETDK